MEGEWTLKAECLKYAEFQTILFIQESWVTWVTILYKLV